MEIVNISFPGIGIDQFSVNKVAFDLFGKAEVRWYGLIITLGIILAFLYTMYRGKRNEGIVPDDVLDIGILTVVLGVIGARLYYVLNDSDHTYESLLDVIAIWNGGIGIYGGIIGGCIGILIMCYVKKISWRKLFDMAAPGVMIAQAIGRWGNFFNGEAFGYPITDTTRFYFFDREHILPSGEGTLFHTLRMGLSYGEGSEIYAYFHPTFLYESLWNILGFILINLFYKRKRFDGQVAVLYFTWYGFGRMFIEGLRTDSLYLPGTTVRTSQFLGLVFFLVGLALFIIPMIVGKRKGALAAADGAGETLVDTEDTPDEESENKLENEENTQTQTEDDTNGNSD